MGLDLWGITPVKVVVHLGGHILYERSQFIGEFDLGAVTGLAIV